MGGGSRRIGRAKEVLEGKAKSLPSINKRQNSEVAEGAQKALRSMRKTDAF